MAAWKVASNYNNGWNVNVYSFVGNAFVLGISTREKADDIGHKIAEMLDEVEEGN